MQAFAVGEKDSSDAYCTGSYVNMFSQGVN